MSFLWSQDSEQQWQATELSADKQVALAGGSMSVSTARHSAQVKPSVAAIVLATRVDDIDNWVIVTRPKFEVRINGIKSFGLTVLADRDQITLSSDSGGVSRFFFSTEVLAHVESYPFETRVICPRCKNSILTGQPAVCCPTCGVYSHHQEPACWTYAPTCAACHNQTTDLDAGFRWTPEGI